MPATLESHQDAAGLTPSIKGVDKGRTHAPDEKNVALEDMTWAELKRAARDVGVKLGVKKHVLIKRIREAREFEAELEKRRNSLPGRVQQAGKGVSSVCQQKVRALCQWFNDDGGQVRSEAERSKQLKKKRMMILGGGLAVGALFGFIAAIF